MLVCDVFVEISRLFYTFECTSCTLSTSLHVLAVCGQWLSPPHWTFCVAPYDRWLLLLLLLYMQTEYSTSTVMSWINIKVLAKNHVFFLLRPWVSEPTERFVLLMKERKTTVTPVLIVNTADTESPRNKTLKKKKKLFQLSHQCAMTSGSLESIVFEGWHSD